MATDSSGEIPDPVELEERIDDPGDYKQARRLRAIFDARDFVWSQREKAWDYLFEGRIDRKAKNKALRMAMEKYIGESMYMVKESQWSQWYWRGEPPTMDGRSPFRENEDGELEMSAVLDEDHADDGEPVLVTDGEGNPIFGTKPCVLGRLQMPEVTRMITFIGIQSYMDVEDPIAREEVVTSSHPLEIEKSESEVFTYQIPEEVTMEAFHLLNDFWARTGLEISKDRGLPVERNFDMSGEDDDLEHGHVSSPDV